MQSVVVGSRHALLTEGLETPNQGCYISEMQSLVVESRHALLTEGLETPNQGCHFGKPKRGRNNVFLRG